MMNVFKKTSRSTTQIDQMNKKLAASFEKIKAEFDEHLLAINENTNEMQSNYEYQTQMDAKLEKLAERIDEISLFLNIGQRSCQGNIITLPLNEIEQQVFLALYMVPDAVSVEVLSNKAGLTVYAAVGHLNNMIRKGIPVIRQRIGEEVHVSLEPHFRDMQTKENVVGISEHLAEKVMCR